MTNTMTDDQMLADLVAEGIVTPRALKIIAVLRRKDIGFEEKRSLIDSILGR